MPDKIVLLPDNIANQIAAGEVIQRPASAVKELLENAVDAGATEIKLIVADAGKMLLQVIDNGSGMSETDARMSFERHATSKIKTSTIFFTLEQWGFVAKRWLLLQPWHRLSLKPNARKMKPAHYWK
ncbi:ATP-binding protein [Niabella ginsengisoli]|uniref:ATP-binding protein n=1 Tax=Niabella ginsengisoli TaxID=522298 RepID=A0ABS9SNA9_9BACT|nr:ATP-binding protein [Niabella ginsengisoli]MCH5599847.1 ATP-binding protein [Niabella ginsengisoli]